MIDRFAFLLPTFDATLDGFGHGNRLRNGEADRRVDRHAAISRFFQRHDTHVRDRNLDLDVWCQ